MLIVFGMAFGHYKMVEDRIGADARLLLEVQAGELIEAYERFASGESSFEDLASYVDHHVESAQEDLKLGIRVHDSGGAVILKRGIFRFREFPDLAESARGRSGPLVAEVDVGDEYPFTVMTTRLPSGFVEVAISSRRFLRSVHDVRDSFLLTLPIALILTAVLGWWLARGSLSPIATMTEAARRITLSQLDEEIPISGSGDELDALAQTLNDMMTRIRLGVERVRGFSSNAAHQLRTPVSLLRSRLDIAATSPRDAESDQQVIEAALGDVERIGDAIRGMLRLADSEAGLRPERRKPVALAPLLEDVVEFFEPVASERKIALTLEAVEAATVSGDAEWLHELFSNLIDNALKYTEAGGSVRVSARRSRARVAVAIQDTGCGIAADELERVFERFQRGRGRERMAGVGLGLAVALEIAQAHGGAIEVQSASGQGAIFTTWLPVSEAGSSD
jgi:signal transduction histidine kinase